jgi:hypothetical protein
MAVSPPRLDPTALADSPSALEELLASRLAVKDAAALLGLSVE